MSNLGHDGWTFLDDEGNPHRRRRNPAGEVPLYDLDYYTQEDLATFADRGRSQPITAFGYELYPTRPLHFRKATLTLWRMAVLKLRGLARCRTQYERLYGTLPEYAQFRRYFNVRGCVVPGKKFRKRPPRP